jgi:hypothetical protein
LCESGWIERGIRGATSTDISRDQRNFELLGHVDARILRQ